MLTCTHADALICTHTCKHTYTHTHSTTLDIVLAIRARLLLIKHTHANKSPASAGTFWWILSLKCVFHKVSVALES